MKTKLLLVLTAIIFSATVTRSQTSDKGFSFQGYAIDPDGKAIGSTGVTVKFTLSPGTFTEEHTLTTDAFGVFTAIVGNSSVASKLEFSKLDFTKKADDYTLKVEVKKTSGGTYTTISNSVMNAVPYARVAANGVPVGTIVAYGGDKNNVPTGWLLCDGASLAKTDYPQLFAAIGGAWGTSGASFNMPDLRGRFLRGVNDGATNDPDGASRTAINTGGNTGNLVGSLQGEAVKSHNHTLTDPTHSHSYNDVYYSEAGGSVSVPSNVGSAGGDNDNAGYQLARTTGASGTGITLASYGGSETRPVNAAVYYIIKY